MRLHLMLKRVRIIGGSRRWASTSAYEGLKCGLEIHLQLNTKTKLFSDSRTSFQGTPNQHVSTYDLAYPGTQPILNKHAVLLALRAALALDCEINLNSRFDRKHYFYPDQPAGYQITQFYDPIARKGVLWLKDTDGIRPELGVGITQLQIEQDTGKSVYQIDSKNTFLDFNRTNHPLIEIVTEPDIRTPQQAAAFVSKLQVLMKHLGVSTGEFQSGAIRVDVNVSYAGGSRCEIKNLASISDVAHAIEAELQRQKDEVSQGRTIRSVTLGWDGQKITVQRNKEATSEYRYIPDPELSRITLTPDIIEKIRSTMNKFPDEVLQELTNAPHKLNAANARTLLKFGLTDYYLECYNGLEAAGLNGKLAANWIVNDILGLLVAGEESSLPSIITPSRLIDLIKIERQNTITKILAMNLVKYFLENPEDSTSAQDLVAKYRLNTVDDNDKLSRICSEVIAEHRAIADTIASGEKPTAIAFLVGMTMKKAKGRFKAQAAQAELQRLLSR
ncbi:GatB/GatE catalytic domain-containing protein [Lipomyces arxii]|uniref:GatB/GatE catalytic domain-containing protein n=1 Tax=Lipomyces arxii TaxID=56418 RepID=UPI0034CFB4EF